MTMKRIPATCLFALALVLATYGITRHAVALAIQKQNEIAFQQYAQTEALLRNQDRMARGEAAASGQFPDHVRRLQLRLGMADGFYAFQDGMVLCLAGAAVLTAIGFFVEQRKRNSEHAAGARRR